MNPSTGPLPKIKARPTIGDRPGGVRQSLEEPTKSQARRMVAMLAERMRYRNGEAAQGVVARD